MAVVTSRLSVGKLRTLCFEPAVVDLLSQRPKNDKIPGLVSLLNLIAFLIRINYRPTRAQTRLTISSFTVLFAFSKTCQQSLTLAFGKSDKHILEISRISIYFY